jgi:hypothetical protein
MEQEPAFTRKFEETSLLSPQQVRESQEQIRDSQELNSIRKCETINVLSEEQIMETRRRASLAEEMLIREKLNKATLDLQQAEFLLTEAHTQDLPTDKQYLLLIETYNCLERVLQQIGREDTRELSLFNNMLRTILRTQLDRQSQELQLLAQELHPEAPLSKRVHKQK